MTIHDDAETSGEAARRKVYDDAFAELQEQITILTESRDALITSLDTAVAERDAARADRAALQDQVASLNTRISMLDLQVAGLAADKVALTNQVATLTTDKSALQSQVANLQGQITTLNATITDLRAQIAALQNPPASSPWDPSKIGFVGRPTGTGYIAIESLGVPLTGDGIRQANTMPAAVGKVLTLPAGTFEFIDYAQGDGGIFMHGLFVSGNTGLRGIVGSGSGTILQMKANSSHFNSSQTPGTGSAIQNTNPYQVLCSTVQFYNTANVEFGNLVVQGTAQPNLHHGIRINGDNIYVHNVKFKGASYGTFNMPPGETYTLMVSGKTPRVEDVEFDGRRDGVTPNTSTFIGVLGCTDFSMKRVYGHDAVSGFVAVQYLGSGFYSEDVWSYRMGTGASGNNGCHTNHEIAGGAIRHVRNHYVQDAYWSNRTRSQGKFPHIVLMEYANGNNTIDANTYADFQIIDPVHDTWGGVAGGFAIAADATITAYPKVIKNGVTLTPVKRPQWWVDVPGFDPAKNYWVAGLAGDASTWG